MSEELDRVKASYENEKRQREQAERAQLTEAKAALENATTTKPTYPTGKENALDVDPVVKATPSKPKESEEVLRL